MIASYYCTILSYSSSSTEYLLLLLQAPACPTFVALHSAIQAYIESFSEVVGYV